MKMARSTKNRWRRRGCLTIGLKARGRALADPTCRMARNLHAARRGRPGATRKTNSQSELWGAGDRWRRTLRIASDHGLHMARATRQHDRRRRAAGHAACSISIRYCCAACSSLLRIGWESTDRELSRHWRLLRTAACRQHVGGRLPTARHAARTSRKPSQSADCSVGRSNEVGAECTSKLPVFARTTFMADVQHTSMASITPHVASTCDLHPHPQHSHPTPLHAKLPSRLPCTPSRVPPSG